MSSSLVKKALSSTKGREKRKQTKKSKKKSDDTLKDYLIWDKHFEGVAQILCSNDDTIQSSSKSRDDKTSEATMQTISSKRLVRQRKKLLKKLTYKKQQRDLVGSNPKIIAEEAVKRAIQKRNKKREKTNKFSVMNIPLRRDTYI